MRRAHSTFAKLVLAAALFPFAAVVGVVTSLFGLKAKLSAAEVAAYLRNFVDGGGGPWDWDDFTSVPLADAKLEGLRRRAAAVELPATEEGMAVLRSLLKEAEQLSEQAKDEGATASSRGHGGSH